MTRLEVQNIDFVDRVLVTSDDRTLPIQHLFDDRGRETADHRCAVVCIAGYEGSWLSVRLGDYQRSALQ